MHDSVFLNLPTPIAVVCHDAGAANHIFSWMEEFSSSQKSTTIDWNLFISGPAKNLRHKYTLPQICEYTSIQDALNESKTLVCGTGWETHVEYDAIAISKQLGIKAIAVLDHWTNYKERFIRHNITILPDEIWVMDKYAKSLARKVFSESLIIQQPNIYLERSVIDIHLNIHHESKNILYLLEPIRDYSWGPDIVNAEFIALDFFIANIHKLGTGTNIPIRIRPHPSDPNGKYEQWVIKNKDLNITLDTDENLSISIAKASVVVGCQTYGMVVALSAGKRVLSSIPGWAPPCVLPHEDILKISELS